MNDYEKKILNAIVAGEQIYALDDESNLTKVTHKEAISILLCNIDVPILKSESSVMVTYNNQKLPRAASLPLVVGTLYYSPALSNGSIDVACDIVAFVWQNSESDNYKLKNKMVFLDGSSAQLWRDAIMLGVQKCYEN